MNIENPLFVMVANNTTSMSITQPSLPIFKGEHYKFCSVKMWTLLKSQELPDLVENGFSNPDDENRLREKKKKDSKALFFI